MIDKCIVVFSICLCQSFYNIVTKHLYDFVPLAINDSWLINRTLKSHDILVKCPVFLHSLLNSKAFFAVKISFFIANKLLFSTCPYSSKSVYKHADSWTTISEWPQQNFPYSTDMITSRQAMRIKKKY